MASNRPTIRLVLGLCWLAGWFTALISGQAAEGPPPVPVVVAHAVESTLAPVTWYPATVISRNDARLAAEVEGRLEWVAEIGTRVAVGETLARLDATLIRKELAENEATVAREEARLAFLDQEVGRLRRLVKQNNVSQSQLDEAVSNFGVTSSELVAAKARVEFARERLKRAVLRAPFAGIVSERFLQGGEWAEIGASVIRLVDIKALEVQLRVPVHTLDFFRKSKEIAIEEGSHKGMGRVRTVVPVGDDLSRLYEVRLIPDSSGWAPGQILRVAVPTAAPRKVVAVPQDALVLRRDGNSVFRILTDDTAEQVRVTTGIASGVLIEVQGDIQPGDRVVVRGGERLRPGQQVEILAAGETSSAAPPVTGER